MSTDTDTIEAQLRCLENENRELRMTLRDQFAEKAMAAFIVVIPDVITSFNRRDALTVVAAMAYDMADKMIEAHK